MVWVAVGQICSRSSLCANLDACVSVIRRASEAGAALIYLPEASDFIAEQSLVPSLLRTLDGSEFVSGVKEVAKQCNVHVGVGVHEQLSDSDKRCYNTNLLISSSGEIIQAYRKTHLFDVDIPGGATILESRTTQRGDELLPPCDTPIGKLGLLTCYDIRFPEPSLRLRRLGAQVLTYPSAFTLRTGAAHWETLLCARAIETQSYVLAPAQVGSHSETRHSYGHAMIVDPWGSVVAQTTDRLPPAKGDLPSDHGTFVLADIDLEWVEKLRVEMPLWEQRRTDLYPVI